MTKISLSIATAATVLIAAGTSVQAAGLPSYESRGLPISAVQVQALGAAVTAQDQSPVATSTATPHQLGVLTPRKRLATATVAPRNTETARAR